MALRQILLSFQRLSLSHATTHVSPTIRAVHTTPICCHKLNRRLYPINREPSVKGRWVERKPMRELYEYTVRPLPMPKLGGRGPNGRIWNWRQGGGRKRHYRMLDLHRSPAGLEKPMVERVQNIVYDPNRSARIALLAGGDKKRYIIATVNMKAGDLITSSRELFDSPIRAAEGDSYPVGSLSIGTVVNSLELYPGDGAIMAMAAGTQAQIIRKAGEHIIVRLPSKFEVAILPTCIATVGRVGNIAHNQKVMGKAGRNRWKGIRPKSGYFQKKTGRFGRKIKKVKPAQVYKKSVAKKDPMVRLPYNLLPQHRKDNKQFTY